MPPKKERYNAKARGSVAGGSVHSHKARKGKNKAGVLGDASVDGGDASANGSSSAAMITDTNAELITDEQRRAQKLMQEVSTSSQVAAKEVC